MSEVLSTAADGQTSGKVHVLQGASNGRREQIARVLHLWTLPAPRGVPQVLVTFDVDAKGNLNVSAKRQDYG